MHLRRSVLFFVVSFGLLVPTTVVQARTLKIATVVPEGSAWMKEMRAVGKQIDQQTQGRVRLKFYPGGVMGTSGALAQVYPDLELYGLPLVFGDYSEVDYVRAHLDDAMIAGLERGGFVALAITDGGFAYLMSQRPMRQVSDLGSAKVWSQEGDVMSATAFEIAGVSPVQLSLADVYTALQTRLIDTVAAPAMGAIALQWHTKVKYLTDVPLTYLTGVFVIDAKVFGTLEAEDQRVVRALVREAARRLDAESRKGEQSARQALREQGIEFVTAATSEEVERWHEITREALVVLRQKQIYSDTLIDELLRLVERYRSEPRADGDP
jgi:TRAP-type C4-dicarboxylate transport system substrate-binding protein